MDVLSTWCFIPSEDTLIVNMPLYIAAIVVLTALAIWIGYIITKLTARRRRKRDIW